MKVWVKLNAGFQLCPLILILPPRSREAGDAPEHNAQPTEEPLKMLQ